MEKKKKELKTWSESTPKEKRKGCLILSLFAFIVAMVVFIIIISLPDESEKPYKDLSIDITAIAAIALEQQLKYPDGWEYERKNVIRVDSVTYNMDAIVLAKNGFGVRSRLGYTFNVKWIGTKNDSYDLGELLEGSNWEMLKSELAQ